MALCGTQKNLIYVYIYIHVFGGIGYDRWSRFLLQFPSSRPPTLIAAARESYNVHRLAALPVIRCRRSGSDPTPFPSSRPPTLMAAAQPKTTSIARYALPVIYVLRLGRLGKLDDFQLFSLLFCVRRLGRLGMLKYLSGTFWNVSVTLLYNLCPAAGAAWDTLFHVCSTKSVTVP